MTHDDILYGRLRLWQPEAGPRVNMDTVLLASWVRRPPRGRSNFIKLGATTGAVFSCAVDLQRCAGRQRPIQDQVASA